MGGLAITTCWLSEVHFILHAWLHSGNRGSNRGVIALLEAALALWGQRQTIRLVRADSGFFDDTPLSFLQQHCLPYNVVTRLTHWVKREARRIQKWAELDANQCREPIPAEVPRLDH